jgi:hypothetical protein
MGFFITRFIIRILKNTFPTLIPPQFVFKKTAALLHLLNTRASPEGRGVNYCHALPRLRELCSATESCWARAVGHVARRATRGQNHRPPKKHKSQAFDFRDLFHVVSHNTQIGVVIHIRVIHGSNPQQNVGPFTCPLFECLPLFTNMLVCQPKSWGDFRDISATVVQ